MEDVTNLPFRVIAKRIGGPGLVFTEFVSAMALHYAPGKAQHKMRIHPDERPLGIQIFGGEPETMARAAAMAQEMGADLVDINMGCWVPKVCRTGAGAALLKDPDMAVRIVSAVVGAVSLPVTVKVRCGWDYSLFSAPDLVPRFVDAGACGITLHARFAKQGFDGEADWDRLSQLRHRIQVPLVGNGDVKTPEDALRMKRETGVDGVMVGRAAISNPWVLRDISLAMRGLPLGPAPTLGERVETALEHLRLMIEDKALTNCTEAEAERFACRHLRGQIPLYVRGYPGAAALRGVLSLCSTYAEYEDALRGFEPTKELETHR